LTRLHVGKNNIPEKEMREIMAIAVRMDSMKILCEIPFKDKTLTELDVSGKNLGMEGALVVAEYLDGNRALSVLNLAENNLGALVLPEGWTEDYDSDDYGMYRHTDGSEQSDNPGEPEGLIAIANAIPNMGAISSVNLLQNKIGSDQAEELASILKEHPTLKSLCGNRGNETKLDMRGKKMDASDAIMLAAEIVGNGAILKFTFSGDDNSKPVTLETSMVEADFREKGLGESGAIMVAAFLPKCT
jgi:hypothetical protein